MLCSRPDKPDSVSGIHFSDAHNLITLSRNSIGNASNKVKFGGCSGEDCPSDCSESTWRFTRRDPVRHCGSNCPGPEPCLTLSGDTLRSAVRTFLIPKNGTRIPQNGYNPYYNLFCLLEGA